MTAFCPVVESSTSNTSFLAWGISLSTTLAIFASSSIRFFLLCSLPAVSQISTSTFLAFAAWQASNKTLDGSEPSFCFTISTSALSAQMTSWSIAAARKVSPAASKTFLPAFLYKFAIFPMDVVFPTPLTPITVMTTGVASRSRPLALSPSRSLAISSFRYDFTTSESVTLSALTLCLRLSIIFSVVGTPKSELIKTSSKDSNSSSSTFPKDANTASIFPIKFSFVFLSPLFSLSKKLILLPLIS